MVGQDDRPAGPHDPGQLVDDPAGQRDVVQAEAGDRAVEAAGLELEPGHVAKLKDRVVDPLPGRLAARDLDHRRRHVDAAHLADPRGEPAGDEPRAAGSLEPPLAWSGGDQVEQAPERIGRPHHRGGIERLRLHGELVDDRLGLHTPCSTSHTGASMAEVRIIIWPNYFADPATAPQRATIDTAAFMPHAKIERVENAGHFPSLEFPQSNARLDRPVPL